MRSEAKEQVAFLAASLIELTNMADMSERGLPYVTKMVGVKAIRRLLRINRLYYDLNFEDMAEKICTYIDWDPTLVRPKRIDRELAQMGRQIADMVEDAAPACDDAADSLFAVLTWCGIGTWLAINNKLGDSTL